MMNMPELPKDFSLPPEIMETLAPIVEKIFNEAPHLQFKSGRIYMNYIPSLGEIRFDVADVNDHGGNPAIVGWLPNAILNISLQEAEQLRDRLNELLLEAQLA